MNMGIFVNPPTLDSHMNIWLDKINFKRGTRFNKYTFCYDLRALGKGEPGLHRGADIRAEI